MCLILQTHPAFKDIPKVYTFANTSKERPETIEFIRKCDEAFNLNLVKLEAVFSDKKGVGTNYKIVDYDNLCMDGSLFEQLIKKWGLPNYRASGCTNELKVVPQNKYIKSLGDYNVWTALGIRYDERHRASKYLRDKGCIFPMIDTLKITEDFVRTFWARQPFDLNLESHQGNCDLCFKKSLRKRATIIQETPEVAQWWDDMEQKYGHIGVPIWDIRQKNSVQDVIQLAKQLQDPFMPSYRKSQGTKDIKDLKLDLEFSCMCGNNG
jgi:3'-phosphoadenosine 5'-phosphosulfate sulfotransferase (PAPS reductase)/FAD synthetase